MPPLVLLLGAMSSRRAGGDGAPTSRWAAVDG
jgi:hypothetical protein